MHNNPQLIKANKLYMQLAEYPITPSMRQLHQWLFDILWTGIINNSQGLTEPFTWTSSCSNVGAPGCSNDGAESGESNAKPRDLLAVMNSAEYTTAQYVYMRAKGATEPPTFEELIAWLYKRGGIDYAMRLRYTLDRVYDELMELGAVAPEEEVTVTGSWILRTRVITQNPPRRPRKKKKG
jgi:hypothetical protein